MEHSQKQILLILVGPPGSGKTYLAEKLFKDDGFVHINSDIIRAKHFMNPQFTAEERARVYAKIKEVITAELQAQRNVIFDGNLLTNEARSEAFEYYQAEVGAKVLFICLEIPRDVAIQQAISRQSSGDDLYNAMPVERVIRMHNTFQTIEPLLPHVTVMRLDDVAAIESQVKLALASGHL